MSLIEDEAGQYWTSSRYCTEYSYFEMGFDKAIDLIGSCMECDYLNSNECPISKSVMKHISKNSFYCASFDSKKVWK